MGKIKRILHNRFLDKPMNKALIFTCFVIIAIQIYFMFETWVSQRFESGVSVIQDNDYIIVLIASFISISPYIIDRFKKNKVEYKIENCPQTTKIFAGAISSEMIDNGEVLPVSKRSTNENNSKPLILDRSMQCKNIVEKIKILRMNEQAKRLNCLFLTGTSGAGKSILLKCFLKEQNEFKFEYFNDYTTSCDLIYQKIKESAADVFIFDQFETSLEYIDIYKYIKKLIDECSKPVFFIFSFPQDVFDRVVMNMSHYVINEAEKRTMPERYLPYYFLNYDEYDIEQLKSLVAAFLHTGMFSVNECMEQCEENFLNTGRFMSILNSGKYMASQVFLCSLLVRIKIGISSLIEFSMVSYIYELFQDEIDYNIEKYIDDIDKVFAIYLDGWTGKFPNCETGRMILQLISDGRNYNIDDIKCITFEPKEYLSDEQGEKKNSILQVGIVDLLKQNQFIQLKENHYGFKMAISTVHGYIAKKIDGYCFETMDNNLRQNVDYYKKKIAKTDITHSPQAESTEKRQILKRYAQFHSNKDRNVIDALVIILIIASTAISSIKGMGFYNKQDNLSMIFVAIGCCLSTLYMYNMVMRFFRMLKKRFFYPLTILGVVLMSMCYLIPSCWGIFAGVEILIFGVSFYGIHKYTCGLARDFFRVKGLLYIAFSLVAIIFGIVYSIKYDEIILRYIITGFFMVYVISSNVTHINYNYIMDKIGKGNMIDCSAEK